jgi:hypothetical protein
VEHPLLKAAVMKTAMFLLALAACSGGSSGPTGDDGGDLPVFEGCPATRCGPGRDIANSAELGAFVDAAPPEWISRGPYTDGCLAASDDLRVTGTMTAQAADIAVPANCAGACRQEVKFQLLGTPAGVECLDPEFFFDFTLCGRLALTDATIRTRMVLVDVHPSIENFIPVVEVMGACEAACGGGEIACAESHTCWGNVRDHCAYCLDGSNEDCACWNGTDFEADGTECFFFTSGDTGPAGTCQSGTCVPNSP